MKRITAIAFSILAGLTTASGAMAQGRVVRATIPFDFTADNRLLPSGTYEITESLGNVIRIQNTADPHITTSIATLRDSTDSHDRSALIFEKYGDRYFLHEIFCPTAMNVSLFRSKEERQIRQQTALVKLEEARQVLIAAK